MKYRNSRIQRFGLVLLSAVVPFLALFRMGKLGLFLAFTLLFTFVLGYLEYGPPVSAAVRTAGIWFAVGLYISGLILTWRISGRTPKGVIDDWVYVAPLGIFIFGLNTLLISPVDDPVTEIDIPDLSR